MKFVFRLYVKQLYVLYFSNQLSKNSQLCNDCNNIRCAKPWHRKQRISNLTPEFVSLLKMNRIEVDIK